MKKKRNNHPEVQQIVSPHSKGNVELHVLLLLLRH